MTDWFEIDVAEAVLLFCRLRLFCPVFLHIRFHSVALTMRFVWCWVKWVGQTVNRPLES